MKSTFPVIATATPAVLAMEARRAGVTPEQYRVGTLKRVEVEILNVLESKGFAANTEFADIFGDLLRQVQIAIADGPLHESY